MQLDEQSDGDLIAAYLEGSTDSLTALVHRHRRGLYGYIMNMTEGSTDADDVFQEVWFKAIKRLGSYKHKNFGGWLIRIAHNSIIDRARRRKPGVSLDSEDADGGSLKETIAAEGFDSARESAVADLRRRIAEAVKTLPEEQKEVFLMRTQSDLPFKEIARIQRVSINTALARMQYALTRLRPLLQDDYEQLAVR